LIRFYVPREASSVLHQILHSFLPVQVDFYRFSISWSRILPLGTTEKVNQAGIEYYNSLINSLIQHEITPVITMHHWDMPMPLQNAGGWVNEEMIEHFGNFARVLYKNFGERVKQWFTFNEAWVICVMGYGDGFFAPGIKEISETPYVCIHTILKAHARAYRIYEEEFKDKQKGQVGITIDSGWLEPSDPNNPEDIKASERALQFKVWSLKCDDVIKNMYPISSKFSFLTSASKYAFISYMITIRLFIPTSICLIRSSLACLQLQ